VLKAGVDAMVYDFVMIGGTRFFYASDTGTARCCRDVHGTDYSIPRGFLDENIW
jgi:hypothetical protein